MDIRYIKGKDNVIETAPQEYKFARKFANFLFLKGESVMSIYRKYKLLEISRLLSHANLHTFRTFLNFNLVMHLLCNTTKIVLK